MANKRMFSKQIVKSDAFMDMPISSQLLYFHLSMEADDDGFIGNPKQIIKMINANSDDFKILLSKRFILPFESGVIVIKHWWIHNTYRKDRYNNTKYEEEINTLQIKDNGAYTDDKTYPRCQIGAKSVPQIKLNKIKLNKNKEVELPIWLNKEKWEEWLQYKKESKKKMTPSTIKKQLKVLEQNKNDQIAIIDKSITCGYIGLFAIENKDTKNYKEPKRYIEPNDSKETNDRRNMLNYQSKQLANKFKV